MLLLLSTVGTSVLTNGADSDTRSWVIGHSNARELDQDAVDVIVFVQVLDESEQIILSGVLR